MKGVRTTLLQEMILCQQKSLISSGEREWLHDIHISKIRGFLFLFIRPYHTEIVDVDIHSL